MDQKAEAQRQALRILFADVYGRESSALKRKVAYKHLAALDDATLAALLLEDLVRGGIANVLLRHLLGESFPAIMIHLHNGDVHRVRELLASAPLEAGAVADLLAQDIGSSRSNIRIDINQRGAPPATGIGHIPPGSGHNLAEIIQQAFKSTGETRTAGLAYLGNLNSPEIMPPLLDLLNSGTFSEADYIAAIELLEHNTHPDVPQLLRELAEAHDNERVRRRALVGLVTAQGSVAEVATGAVQAWGTRNKALAVQVLAQFGDIQDTDELLWIMMQRNESEPRRTLAACALTLTDNLDYVPGLLQFIQSPSKGKLRWQRLYQVEQNNTPPQLDRMFADYLRDKSYQKDLQTMNNDELQSLQVLIRLLGQLGTERAQAALSRARSNPSLPSELREAAQRALQAWKTP